MSSEAGSTDKEASAAPAAQGPKPTAAEPATTSSTAASTEVDAGGHAGVTSVPESNADASKEAAQAPTGRGGPSEGATATGDVRSGGGGDAKADVEAVKTDVDEIVEAVSLRARELGRNVAELASSAGLDPQNVVTNLSEKVSGFGTGFASLFSVFDPSAAQPAPTPNGASPAPPSSPADADAAADSARRVASRAFDLQANFGLPPEESLLEAFPCKLIQTYSCAHNAFTPDIPKAFPGTLYITEKNVCFLVQQKERHIPIRLKVEDLSGVSQEHPRGSKRTDSAAGDILKITLKASASPEKPDKQWLSLSDFPSVHDLESAFALMEHLTGSE